MEATPWNQSVLVTYSMLTSLGLFGHVVLLIPLCKYYRTHFSKPFYIICISLAICDIFNLIQNMVNQITNPLLFTNTSVMLPRWKGIISRFFWYGTSFHQLLIAMERSIVVLYPPGSKLVLTKSKVFIGLLLAWMATILCNFCVLTDYCPYIWYQNTTTVFYNTSIFSATLHNKIVDWGVQAVVVTATIVFYALAGLKVRSVRKKVQNKTTNNNNAVQKKNRLENILLLQGVFVSIPHTFVIIVYQMGLLIPNISYTSSQIMTFVGRGVSIIGFSLNPILHLVMNKDMRTKTAETFCTVKVLEVSGISTGVALSKSRRSDRTNVSKSIIEKTGDWKV